MRATTALLFLAVYLAGCGFKGPLYLAPPKAAVSKPAPPPLPDAAPERPVPSEAAPPPQ